MPTASRREPGFACFARAAYRGTGGRAAGSGGRFYGQAQRVGRVAPPLVVADERGEGALRDQAVKKRRAGSRPGRREARAFRQRSAAMSR